MRMQLAALAIALLAGGNLSAQGTVNRPEQPKPPLLVPLLADSLDSRLRRAGIPRPAKAEFAIARVRSARTDSVATCPMPVARLDSSRTSSALERDLTLGARTRDPMAMYVEPFTCPKR